MKPAASIGKFIWIGAAAALACAGLGLAQTAPAPKAAAPAAPAPKAAPPATAPAAATPPAAANLAPPAAPAPKAATPGAETAPPPASVPTAANSAAAAPEPAEEAPPPVPKAPEAPQRRARYDVAVLQALDKVTAETLRFEARVGQPVRYKTLIFTVHACEHSAPDEPVEDNVAYLTIDSQPKADPGHPVLPPKQVFKGWMYASSPGLNPLEHPVYDAWVISCRAAAPSTVASR